VNRAFALLSERFAACVDPRHGGEIFSLVDLERGRQVLARPASSPEDLGPDALGFEEWVRGYRGGWQFVGPNVGAACHVDGAEHGFHGRASTAPWEAESVGPGEAVLSWSGDGLSLRRRIRVENDGVHVELGARAAERRAPLLVAEHVAFGVEMLDPEVRVELEASQVYEWGGDGPFVPPAEAPAWPEGLRLGDHVDRVDRMPGDGPGCLLTASGLGVGRVRVSNPVRGLGYELTWDDPTWLRHIWLWREEHGAGGPWRNRASLLVVEPASVAHDRGLAKAIEADEARWLEPGEEASYRLSLSVAED
jgi:hypothetical protein